MQTMLNKLRLGVYAQRTPFGSLSLSIHISWRWCASFLAPSMCPLSFMMARSSPTQTLSNIWAWFVTDTSIWILQLMQHCIHSQIVLPTTNSYGSMTLPIGNTFTCGSLEHTQFLTVCMQARSVPPHSCDKADKWTTLCKNGCWWCSGGLWWSGTQPLYGASLAIVVSDQAGAFVTVWQGSTAANPVVLPVMGHQNVYLHRMLVILIYLYSGRQLPGPALMWHQNVSCVCRIH